MLSEIYKQLSNRDEYVKIAKSSFGIDRKLR